jgi:hypothetical protein
MIGGNVIRAKPTVIMSAKPSGFSRKPPGTINAKASTAVALLRRISSLFWSSGLGLLRIDVFALLSAGAALQCPCDAELP